MVFGMQMVDVFGAGPLAGNPLAVITGAGALSTEDMQCLTRWFNLSETAFLLPPRRRSDRNPARLRRRRAAEHRGIGRFASGGR